MNAITVDKVTILERIKVNRSEHRKIVEEAWAGYLEAVSKEAAELIALARNGTRKSYQVTLTLPQDHTNDYDAVIDMLESSMDTSIEISASDFRCYVRDEWSWQATFLRSNSSYSISAAAKLVG